MSLVVKPLANSVATGVATNVYNATVVYLANDTTARLVSVANTRSIENGGGVPSSIRVPANGQLVIKKRPTDTVTGGATCFATKIADGAQ